MDDTLDAVKVYDDTLNRMKIILKNIKTTAPVFTRKNISNLKVDLAKQIHKIDKNALEEHIKNKNKETTTKNTRTCASCKD